MTNKIQADKDYFYVNKNNLEAIKEHKPLDTKHLISIKQQLYNEGLPIYGIILMGLISVIFLLTAVFINTYSEIFVFSIFLFMITVMAILSKYGLKLRIQSYVNKMNKLSNNYQMIEAKINKYTFFSGIVSFSYLDWAPHIRPRTRNKKRDEAVAWYEFVSPKTGKKLKGKCVYAYSFGHTFKNNNSEVETMPALVAYQSDEVFALV